MARSNIEAEYRSLALATVEVTWIKSLLVELKMSHAPLIIVTIKVLWHLLIIQNQTHLVVPIFC